MDAIASHITQGALRTLFDGEPGQVVNPVFQCLHIKHLDSKGAGQERYRVVLSDVRNHGQTMLATHENHLVNDGVLKRGSLIRVKEYEKKEVQNGRRFLILVSIDVLSQYGEHEKLGAPVAIEPPLGGDVKKETDVRGQPEGISGGNFYGNKAPQAQQTNAPVKFGNDSAWPNLRPIEALSLYGREWTIKARCTSKSDIKTWHNKNGEGRLFSVNLLDESGEIRATGFNDQCDTLFDIFQEGGVYYISDCSVKYAKKQFTNIKNDYELMFEQRSVVERTEGQDNVPKMMYNFTGLGDLTNVEKDTTIDVIGVLEQVAETSQVLSKTTSKPYDKRELTLVDNSLFKVRLTIWGSAATTFSAPLESVIAFKGVKVSDFGGRSLSLLSSGSMSVDPDIEEAFRLKGWYDADGRQEDFQAYQGGATASKDTMTVAAVKDLDPLALSEKMKMFTLKATIVYIQKTSFSYLACISPDCNKKVTETSPGQWFCEKCDQAHDRAENRYSMIIGVNDHTGELKMSCFDDAGRVMMGVSADELANMRDTDEHAMEETLAEARFKTYNFRCGAKLDSYGGEQRIRYRVMGVNPLKYSDESHKLIAMLKKYDLNSDSLFV